MSKIRIKKDEDLNEIEKLLFSKAEEIAEILLHSCDDIALPWINSIMKKHNGLDQVLVYSFFGKIINIFYCTMILGIKKLADDCGDNEITVRNLFDEFIEGNAILLNLKSINLPQGIRKQNGIKT